LKGGSGRVYYALLNCYNNKTLRSKSLNKEQGLFGSLGDKLTDYNLLVKFKLNLTVVFSAIMAYLIAFDGTPSWIGIALLGVGGFLVTGAANALNQVLERDFDKMMKRTENRPLAAGRMSVSEAVLAAGLMCMAGTFCLSIFNAWAGLLGMLSMVLYSFVYIAWAGDEDYKRAGFHLLPNKTGALDSSVGMQSLIYALFLVPVSFLPYLLGVTGIISAIIIAISSLIYAGFGWNLYKKCTRAAALRLMFSSFVYLPLVLFALYFDKRSQKSDRCAVRSQTYDVERFRKDTVPLA